MDAHTRFRTRIVGALPVITHYFERIDLAATIDGLVPWQGDVPLGTLVEVLVANRLLQPKALFRVGQWAETAAVSDYFGLTSRPPWFSRRSSTSTWTSPRSTTT